MATASDRVSRMLAMVPYCVNHPGVTLEELSRLFATPEPQIRRDLDLLFMTGIPPYGPGDLVSVDIEDGAVWVGMADHLQRPQKLTRPEAVSLYVRGQTVAATPGMSGSDALASALGKIEDALGEDALGGLRGHVEGAERPPEGGWLDIARGACDASERLDIDYFSFYSDELTSRRIDPEKVFWAIGQWYLVAWDEGAGGERIFRLDRLREARPTGEHFQPRGLQGAGRPLYAPSAADVRVRLRLAPGAFWVSEYFECSEVRQEGEDLVVTLATRSLQWLAKLALRLVGLVEVLEPEELRGETRRLAAQTLALYAT